jgi:GxxExxY protein
MSNNEISKIVLDCAFEVHTVLGPGLLESAYQKCLAFELRQKGLKVVEEKKLPLLYKGVALDCDFRLDLWIEDQFLVEVKSIEKCTDIHVAQVITYLKLSNTHLALLLNFNVGRLKDGIKRVVHDFME